MSETEYFNVKWGYLAWSQSGSSRQRYILLILLPQQEVSVSMWKLKFGEWEKKYGLALEKNLYAGVIYKLHVDKQIPVMES